MSSHQFGSTNEADARDESDPAASDWQLSHERDALSGAVMKFDLISEMEALPAQAAYENGGPAGKTLVKEPDLRVVLIALKAEGRMEEHGASGPVSLQMIKGSVELDLPNGTMKVGVGELLVMEPGIKHQAKALEDSAFLLTIGRTAYPLRQRPQGETG